LFDAWIDVLRRSVASSDAVLQFLRSSPRTWRAGQAIKGAIAPISNALVVTSQYLAHPHPTRIGPEATSEDLRNDIATKLVAFEPVPLLDEVAAAVLSDCTAQRGTPATTNSVGGITYAEGASNGRSSGTVVKKTKGKNIGAKMLKELSLNPESLGWAASKWAKKFKCADSTVKGTSVWQEKIMAARALNKADAVVRMGQTKTTRS
jgi:hypothetical protein